VTGLKRLFSVAKISHIKSCSKPLGSTATAMNANAAATGGSWALPSKWPRLRFGLLIAVIWQTTFSHRRSWLLQKPGERDPERLCDGVLMEFRRPPPQA
jgi:hypothetical protein